MTATRIGKGATLAAAAAVWLVCAWLLFKTSVPSLHLSGFDEHRFFSSHLLARARSYTRGEDLIFALSTLAELIALGVLCVVLPKSIRQVGLGRIGSAIVGGMVILVTIWFVELPFSLFDLWWQHHWGLGPFHVLAWLAAQWSTLLPLVISAMAGIVLLVGLAGRFRRYWWLVAWPALVAIVALFAFTGGWLLSAGSKPIDDPLLQADATRLARVEGVSGTPVRVMKVSDWTDQVNAYTAGFGPSTHVVLWDTLLDNGFSRGEEDVVIAHELGHVRSRHILKGIGWSALIVLPTLWIIALVTRRRGGVADPANLPLVFLLLTVLSLLTMPIQNEVSRRYEAEADWRALNATRDPTAGRELFQSFGRTSLEDPDPGALDYLFLETHPTLMQRIAMTQRWSSDRSSRGGPGSP